MKEERKGLVFLVGAAGRVRFGSGGTLRRRRILRVKCGPVRPIRVSQVAVHVAVVVADPSHRKWKAGFIVSLGRAIKECVNREQIFGAASKRGIRVEDSSRLVFCKKAEAGRFFAGVAGGAEVVGIAGRQLFLGEGDAEVPVEGGVVRRGPGKAPAHPLLEGFDLWQGRARNRGERYIALRNVHNRAGESVVNHRATRAALGPVGAEHEVVNSQLAAAVEKIGKRFLSAGTVEDIILFDANPRQRAALRGKRIAQMRELLFFLQQRLARRQPLGGSCDAGTFERGSGHDCFSFIFVSDVSETSVSESGLSLRKRLMRRTLVSASASTPPLELTLTANAARRAR